MTGCFGNHVLINEFKNKFIKTQDYVESLGHDAKLRVSWKMHILCVHLPIFLSRHNCGMRKFSEQCGESVHHAMKRILARFCVSAVNPKHGERLKRAVVEFSTERL